MLAQGGPVALRHDDDQRGLTGMASVVSGCQSTAFHQKRRSMSINSELVALAPRDVVFERTRVTL